MIQLRIIDIIRIHMGQLNQLTMTPVLLTPQTILLTIPLMLLVGGLPIILIRPIHLPLSGIYSLPLEMETVPLD